MNEDEKNGNGNGNHSMFDVEAGNKFSVGDKFSAAPHTAY